MCAWVCLLVIIISIVCVCVFACVCAYEFSCSYLVASVFEFVSVCLRVNAFSCDFQNMLSCVCVCVWLVGEIIICHILFLKIVNCHQAIFRYSFYVQWFLFLYICSVHVAWNCYALLFFPEIYCLFCMLIIVCYYLFTTFVNPRHPPSFIVCCLSPDWWCCMLYVSYGLLLCIRCLFSPDARRLMTVSINFCFVIMILI